MRKVALAIAAVLMSQVALAEQPCEHPVFVTQCQFEQVIGELSDGEDGERGPRGYTGEDGEDGRDGIDGVNGTDGVDGIDGRDGVDGVVPRGWYNQLNRYIAATTAVTAYLPQDDNDRVTFGVSRVHGTTGVGIGYARVLDRDDRFALTLTFARAGHEKAATASVGWEF